MPIGKGAPLERLFFEVEPRLGAFNTEVKKGEQNLRTFTSTAEKSTVAAGALGAAFEKVGASKADQWIAEMQQKLRGLNTEMDKVSAANRELEATQRGLAVSAADASKGATKIRQGLSSIAIAAAGVTGPVGRVIEGLGLLALGGGVVTSAALGLALVVSIYHEMTEESRKAREETDKLIDSLIRAANIRQDPGFAEGQDALTLARRLGEIDKRLQQERRGTTVADETGAVNTFIDQKAILELERERLRVIRAINEAQQQAGENRKDAAEAAAREAEQAARELEQVEKARAAFRKELETGLVRFTETQVDDIETALAQFQREAEERLKELPPAVRPEFERMFAAVLAQFRDQIKTTRIEEALDRLEARHPTGPLPVTRVFAPRGSADDDLDSFQKELKRINDLERERQERAERIARAMREQVQNARLQADAIEDAARGALQLGQAFGLVSDETAETLTNLVQIAASIQEVTTLLNTDGVKISDLVAPLLGAAGGIASLVSGLFGESPEDRRRREAVERNNDLLEQLNQRIGDLGLDISGSESSGAGAALTAFFARFRTALTQGPSAVGDVLRTGLPEELQRVGLTMQDLRRIAAELGIDLNGGIQALEQLQEALANAELARFAESFSGRLQALQAEFEIFDISNPIDQFKKLRAEAARLGTGSPLVEQLLGNVDVTTAAGRAAADAAIKELLERLRTEGGVSAAELGGLTGEQLLEILLQLERTLDDIEGQAAGQTEGFNVDRTITEVTGGRVVSVLTSVATNTGRTADAVEALLASLGSGLTPSLPTPALPSPSGGTVVEIGDINVNTGPMPVEDARTVGLVITDRLVDEIDRRIATKERLRAMLLGQN